MRQRPGVDERYIGLTPSQFERRRDAHDAAAHDEDVLSRCHDNCPFSPVRGQYSGTSN